jgi:DNA-directed RNA polymerase II subunit RPB2
MENSTLWNIIDSYFNENPSALVNHHIESYNDFFENGIFKIFKEKNPLKIQSDYDETINDYRHQCIMHFGGRDGTMINFGKPVIYDNDNSHYMFPNEARLRNLQYSMTIHYDIELEFIQILREGESPSMICPEFLEHVEKGSIIMHREDDEEEEETNVKRKKDDKKDDKKDGGEEKREVEEDEAVVGGAPLKTRTKKVRLETTPAIAVLLKEAQEKNRVEPNKYRCIIPLKNIFLGKIPIMLQSKFCILNGLSKEARYNMGECRNDLGGYFIIDGKEKIVVPQEKFGDNMLYIRKFKEDINTDIEFLCTAEIHSVSENVSKPTRTMYVKMVAPTVKYTNRNIVVNIPNVRKEVPLFIVFRALGIISDKDIIEICLLDLEKYEDLVDLFAPSVHDAGCIFTQRSALAYIATLTKGKTDIDFALEIITDYFLPHIGETNYREKAFYLGHMVFKMLSVQTGMEIPTDRDNFKYKRIELVGTLIDGLFREYYNIQQKQIYVAFEKKLYFKKQDYQYNLYNLIYDNYRDIFRERSLEVGFKKAFKGNWGAFTHTKRLGVVQDLNRLSFNTMMSHLRKTSLPMDASLKVVGPRLLHNSQWGFIDPMDTPDGGNIGFHKNLSIGCTVSRGFSRNTLVLWLREKIAMKLVEDCNPRELSSMTKVIVNGFWAGSVDEPIETVDKIRLYRRNALIPIYTSVTFEIKPNTIFIYTDGGRLCRPIFYIEENKLSYDKKEIMSKLVKGNFSWENLITGFNKKRETLTFIPSAGEIYELNELYDGINSESNPAKLERFHREKAIIDYIDSSETENTLIAITPDELLIKKMATHCEIHESLLFGVMCNQITFPETNPLPRNLFSCGQSKQACSLYHTNFPVRMDKTAVVLNYGQIPLVKSRYGEYINNEENPYGENAIVAIMCYTGYNVEDAVLINEAAIQRGMFRTTYYTTYESHEETSKKGEVEVNKRFTCIEKSPSVMGIKPGYDYSHLDDSGLVREGTVMNDKIVVIGLTSNNTENASSRIDMSKSTKKGQLGVVDKTFITEGEEGERIAKVRICEQRQPAMGDKFASRVGQKGTIGLIIPERDMPFTREGIRPDIIINPHALPSRMTIGQLVESITGKACAMYGGFADCTAFNQRGSKIGIFGNMLKNNGFHSSGNEILYNGMTGEQIETEIFMGPTYYMRLKHMVKDKINYRARGPNTMLTKQPVSGRANDGGLRIGEMERDSLISHGISAFLTESMMERSDKYFMSVCNNTGMLAIYNPAKNLFISPMADGPIRFLGNIGEDISENGGARIEHITRFGRNFSVISVPYTMKLLIQELQCMNIQLRIITEDTIQQIENMSYKEIKDTKLFIQNIKNKLSSTTTTPITTTHEDNEWRITEPEIEEKIKTKTPEEDKWYVIDNETGKYPDYFQNKPGGGIELDIPQSMGGEQQKINWNLNANETYSNQEEQQQDFGIGEQVFLHGDVIQQRIWVVKDITPNGFITIETEDAEDGEDTIKVVNYTDIIHPHNAIYEQPQQNQFMQPQFMQNQNPFMQPNGGGITISPVINNIIGNNDKNNDDSNTQPPMKPNKTKQKLEEMQGGRIHSNSENSEGSNSGGGGILSGMMDFGKLVIKKLGS